MKGKNWQKPEPGRSKHKSRPRPKYASQWARTATNKQRNVERQLEKCSMDPIMCRCPSKPANANRSR